ncbi:MAG TPA: LysM peptidoglycan-binding domain-containing protein [Anaerolineae bacterium]|nr:LysM peptidoglycan-binding domain-containing protein [Anaerolineae bacterium]
MADSRWQIADGRWQIRLRLFVSIPLLSLLLPLGLGAVESAPLRAGEIVYTVQKDDNLWSLAEKYLGNGAAYTAIVAATNARNAQDPTFAEIANPRIIQPGWRILIPAPEDAGALIVSYKPPEPEKLTLATTTSTENSGLLAHILPDFEAKYNAKVEVIAVGTGQALKLGEDGNCDVVLVHARSKEEAFVEAGYGVNRKDLMYNDFVIVGPASDPAGVKGMTDVGAALARIAKTQSQFVSRGDDSGTHIKEQFLWKESGLELQETTSIITKKGQDSEITYLRPSGGWYISAGQGMGAVLTMADELQAYTLTDRGTYLARTLGGIDLVILVEGAPRLFNPYGIIAVNPQRHPHVNFDLAMSFINWFTSVPTQKMIGEFGKDRFGQPLFVPDSEAWRAAQ